MWTPRRRKGFELAGTVRPKGLGLRKSPTTRMRVLLVWREIAGPSLADLAQVSVSRGLLDVVACFPEARGLLEPVLPLIASRISNRLPGLKIRRWRLTTDGDSGPRPSGRPIEPLSEATTKSQAPRAMRSRNPAAQSTSSNPPDPVELLKRLEAVSERYLAKQARIAQKP